MVTFGAQIVLETLPYAELCDGGRGSYMKGQLGEGSFAAVSAARKNLQLLPFHL